MEIAIRNSTKLQSLKPYVTDGLVGMYDFKYNTGIGKYDETAAVWKDLVGNRDMEISADCAEWTDEGLRAFNSFTGLESYNEECRQFTIELCIKSLTCGDDSIYFSTTSLYGYGIGLWGRKNRGTSRIYTSIVGWDRGYVSLDEVPIFKSVAGTFSFVVDRDDRANIFTMMNATQVQKWNWQSPPTDLTYAFGCYFNANANSQCIFKNIRFYDRCLTTDELASNYVVDKERFGI